MITLNIHQREARLLERVAELEQGVEALIENHDRLISSYDSRIIEKTKRITELKAEKEKLLKAASDYLSYGGLGEGTWNNLMILVTGLRSDEPTDN